MYNLETPYKITLKALAEGVLTSATDKTLLKLKLVTPEGKLTGKGLAYAVGHCGASISKHFEKFPKEKAKWSQMLANIEPYMSGKEELDLYFKANMQTYIDFDYFRDDGWFKDFSNLSKKEILERRLATIEKFLELANVSSVHANSVMQLASHNIKRQIKELEEE